MDITHLHLQAELQERARDASLIAAAARARIAAAATADAPDDARPRHIFRFGLAGFELFLRRTVPL